MIHQVQQVYIVFPSHLKIFRLFERGFSSGTYDRFNRYTESFPVTLQIFRLLKRGLSSGTQSGSTGIHSLSQSLYRSLGSWKEAFLQGQSSSTGIQSFPVILHIFRLFRRGLISGTHARFIPSLSQSACRPLEIISMGIPPYSFSENL